MVVVGAVLASPISLRNLAGQVGGQDESGSGVLPSPAEEQVAGSTGLLPVGCPIPKAQGRASPEQPLTPPGHPRNREPLSVLPLPQLAFRLYLLAVSGLRTLHLSHFLWPGGGEEGYVVEIRRGRLWPLLLGHIFLYGLR